MTDLVASQPIDSTLRQKIETLEAEMLQHEQLDVPTKHYFVI